MSLNRLVIVLNGVRVDVTVDGLGEIAPEIIGNEAKYYAELLAKGYTFDMGGGKHPPPKEPRETKVGR